MWGLTDIIRLGPYKRPSRQLTNTEANTSYGDQFLLPSREAEDLAHGVTDPGVQQIAVEARMPNDRISNLGNLFRRLQSLKVEPGQRSFCDSRRHRQHQVCGLKDSDGSLEIRKMDRHVPPQSSFSKRPINKILLVRLCLY